MVLKWVIQTYFLSYFLKYKKKKENRRRNCYGNKTGYLFLLAWPYNASALCQSSTIIAINYWVYTITLNNGGCIQHLKNMKCVSKLKLFLVLKRYHRIKYFLSIEWLRILNFHKLLTLNQIKKMWTIATTTNN